MLFLMTGWLKLHRDEIYCLAVILDALACAGVTNHHLTPETLFHSELIQRCKASATLRFLTMISC